MLNVIMLSVMRNNYTMQNAIKLNVIAEFHVFNIVLLFVITINAVMLSVVAPHS